LTPGQAIGEGPNCLEHRRLKTDQRGEIAGAPQFCSREGVSFRGSGVEREGRTIPGAQERQNDSQWAYHGETEARVRLTQGCRRASLRARAFLKRRGKRGAGGKDSAVGDAGDAMFRKAGIGGKRKVM